MATVLPMAIATLTRKEGEGETTTFIRALWANPDRIGRLSRRWTKNSDRRDRRLHDGGHAILPFSPGSSSGRRRRPGEPIRLLDDEAASPMEGAELRDSRPDLGPDPAAF